MRPLFLYCTYTSYEGICWSCIYLPESLSPNGENHLLLLAYICTWLLVQQMLLLLLVLRLLKKQQHTGTSV